MPADHANKKPVLRSLSGNVALRDAPETKRGPGKPRTGNARADNPNIAQRSVFLPVTAYADAQAILLKSNAATGAKVTVSDILSEYLTKWVKQH